METNIGKKVIIRGDRSGVEFDTRSTQRQREMKHNPFVPREWRTAILTFDNGHRAHAEVLLPGTDKPVWHADLERRLVRDFNKSQPHAVHKVVKIHLLRN